MISIGKEFEEERKRQKLTVEEVSKATKIRPEFLEAIEEGKFEKLPSPAYAHGFVRNYAKFLGLPVEKTLALFRREFDAKKSFEVLPNGLANPNEYNAPRFRLGRSSMLIAAVGVLLLVFLIYQYRSALFNPPLKVDYPKENEVVNSLNFEVRGKTDSNATLYIENEPVTVQSDGTFRKDVTIFPGTSTINLRVVNSFGKETKLLRRVEVKQGY